MRTPLLIGLCALLVACDSKPPEPTTKPVPTNPAPPGTRAANAPSTAAATTPATAPGQITWSKPDAWKHVDNPSQMRKATYEIPAAEGSATAEMSVTQVGGTIDANIKRWEGQFAEGKPAKVSDSEVNGLKVTVVEIEGTFTGGGPMMGGGGEPQKDWAMLAAIVHTKPAHFFKMTGPQQTVKGSRADFDVLVGSFATK